MDGLAKHGGRSGQIKKWLKVSPLFLFLFMMISCTEQNGRENISKIEGNESSLYEILGPDKTGIDFENRLTESLTMNGLIYEYYYNGAGLAVADFNNDGLQDVFFVSNLYPNQLYLNTGNLTFKDVSRESGTANHAGFPTGVTTVDINNDGLMDIYLSNSGQYTDAELRKNELYINQGVNSEGIPWFKEEASAYNLDIDLCSTQAAFFDYDRDGDLDMFLINQNPNLYAFQDIEELQNTKSNITGDRLYQNTRGVFTDVTDEAGIINSSLGYGLGIGISDLNNDGWPDVYVSNDFSAKDYLYMNNRNGTFTETIDHSLFHIPKASMGNDLSDFNNDGWADIVTLEMMAEDNYTIKTSAGMASKDQFLKLVDWGMHHQYLYNALQLNNGVIKEGAAPVFSDLAQMAGVSSTDWSWAPLLFDMDNDGLKDLFIANGIKRDFINKDYLAWRNNSVKKVAESKKKDREALVVNVLKRMPERKKSNYFFRNNGDLTFEKMNGTWAQDLLTCSNGSAYADFDNDGDLDIIVNNSESPSFIYKNNAMEQGLGNYLQIQLAGPKDNLNGLGARVIIQQADQLQMQDQYLSRGFQSSVSPLLHFGLGTDTIVRELEIIWPDGKSQILENVSANQTLRLTHANAGGQHLYSFIQPSLFTDATQEMKLSHQHIENNFDDFTREPMLPHSMSDLGPALAVGDVDNDGFEDFYIGGAKGYPGELYLQSRDGFTASNTKIFKEDQNCEDVCALFMDADSDGDADLYIVSGGNEDLDGSANLQDRFYMNTGAGEFKKMKNALPDMSGSGSCVKAGDYDGDGDLDLFIGGRQVPGKYPLPASSQILRNDSEANAIRFKDVTKEIAPQLTHMGMVTDASMTDLNGDGMLDLVLVGEWMPVRILFNKGSGFEETTAASGMSEETGWWNCVVPGDFDQDGDMDFVAGNLGLNYKYKADKKFTFDIYAKDFDNNGKLDIVLGYYNNNKLYPLRGLSYSSKQLPFLNQKFPTFDTYGKATLNDVYGKENLTTALSYKANNFATCYFKNNGNGTFDIFPLDNMAQISSINSIIAEDLDGDGHLDLVIGGNLYGSEFETPRNDASIGLFLKGNGAGAFVPVPSNQSGLLIKGNVRALRQIQLEKSNSRGLIVAKNSGLMQILKITEE